MRAGLRKLHVRQQTDRDGVSSENSKRSRPAVKKPHIDQSLANRLLALLRLQSGRACCPLPSGSNWKASKYWDERVNDSAMCTFPPTA